MIGMEIVSGEVKWSNGEVRRDRGRKEPSGVTGSYEIVSTFVSVFECIIL